MVLACVEPEAVVHPAPPGTAFCCGVHPWNAAKPDAMDRLRAIRDLVDRGRLAAVGETGFDRIRREVPLEAQVELFRLQARLAEEAALPLVLHSVRSNADILAESVRLRPRSRWIVHGCSAGGAELDRLLSKGIAVSMGPRELSRPGAADRLRRVPPDLLFLETDEAATPIAEVYHRAARLLECSTEDLARRIFRNWRELFGEATAASGIPT